MEDAEGVLSFDFEGGLESGSTNPTATISTIPSENHATSYLPAAGPNTTNIINDNTTTTPTATNSTPSAADIHAGGRRSFRQTVCRHWLRSLCMKGDACGFLHQYDKSRMPVCRFFRLYGECREQDCVYKHTNEDIKECNMYKLGFCPNGPDCRYRHVKLPGPPPSVEEVVQKIQQLNSYGYGNPNKFFQQRQQMDKTINTTISQPAAVVKPLTTANNLHQHQQQQQQQVGQIQNVPNGLQQQNMSNRTTMPLPQGISRYFIVKSCNRENLELSVQGGVWATQRNNEAKLNEAFDCAENVILIFSVNRTRHFQGCAKMTSKIGASVGGGNWKYAHGTAHYGRNFSVKWLKLCELSFHKTRHLRNPYNENLPVKISRDCQELEPSIGEQLASLLYLEPDSELMAVSLAAEAKREEEKEKGVNPDSGGENPDIVPFEDNEEEEEEESEEEDEAFGQPLGAAAQGRGRGRGIMLPPHIPIARGARPIHGMRGFPSMMMGADGFPYGAVAPDSFGMPDPFGAAPRGFPSYGPRFSMDFTGATSGMMFPGQPSQPGTRFPAGGFGMMMGPGRAPFFGGMGPAASNPLRGTRPGGMFATHLAPSSQNNSRSVKRDHRTAANDRNDRHSVESDLVRNAAGEPNDETKYLQGKASHEDQIGAVNIVRSDDSESEDEAPRRSRHGEGKKKRRDSEGDAALSL